MRIRKFRTCKYHYLESRYFGNGKEGVSGYIYSETEDPWMVIDKNIADQGFHGHGQSYKF